VENPRGGNPFACRMNRRSALASFIKKNSGSYGNNDIRGGGKGPRLEKGGSKGGTSPLKILSKIASQPSGG